MYYKLNLFKNSIDNSNKTLGYEISVKIAGKAYSGSVYHNYENETLKFYFSVGLPELEKMVQQDIKDMLIAKTARFGIEAKDGVFKYTFLGSDCVIRIEYEYLYSYEQTETFDYDNCSCQNERPDEFYPGFINDKHIYARIEDIREKRYGLNDVIDSTINDNFLHLVFEKSGHIIYLNFWR